MRFQPDYSLAQLSFSREETARLFLHITDIEKRQDQRLAHLVRYVARKRPRWKEWMHAVTVNEGLFPSDTYWEEKVDPHLKVVEPPQRERKRNGKGDRRTLKRTERNGKGDRTERGERKRGTGGEDEGDRRIYWRR